MNAVAHPPKLDGHIENVIDIVDLIARIWRQKVLVGAVTLLVGIAGVLYAYTATKYYSVQSVLRPAPIRELDQLNQFGLYSLSPQDALQRLGAALDSYEARLGFYQAHSELFEKLGQPGRSLEQSFEQFNDESFRMLWPDTKERASAVPFVGVQLTYPEGLDGPAIVNQFVAYAADTVRSQISRDLETLIANRLSQLNQKIGAARASYEATRDAQIAQLQEADALKRARLEDELNALRQELKTRRLNRISQLDEAIGIAKVLGITKPTTPSSMGDRVRADQNVVRTEINNQQLPLYFMGSEALLAERKALQQRSSDDFTEPRILKIASELELLKHNRQVEALRNRQDEDLFLKDLASWRQEAASLRAIYLDIESLKIATVDQGAVEPRQALRPNKALVVALSLILGAMLGVFIALIRVPRLSAK